jgi:hypothetical protein
MPQKKAKFEVLPEIMSRDVVDEKIVLLPAM